MRNDHVDDVDIAVTSSTTGLPLNWTVAASVGIAVVNFAADVWAATVVFAGSVISSTVGLANTVISNPFVALLLVLTLLSSAFMYRNEHNVMAGAQVIWSCTVRPVLQHLLMPIIEIMAIIVEKALQTWNFVWMLEYKYIGDLLFLPIKCRALPEFIVTAVVSIEPLAKGFYLTGTIAARALCAVSPDPATTAATAAFILRPLSTISAAASDVIACGCSSGTYFMDIVTLILADRHLECMLSNLIRAVFEVVAILIRTLLELLLSIATILIWLLKLMFGLDAGVFPAPNATEVFLKGTDLLVDDLDAATCCASDFIDDIGGSTTYLVADITGTHRDKIEPLLVGGLIRGPLESVLEAMYLMWRFSLDWMLHGYNNAVLRIDDSRFYGAQIDACESIAGSFAHTSHFIGTGVDAGVAFVGRVVVGNFSPVAPGAGARENETVLTTLGTVAEVTVNAVAIAPLVLGYESMGKICTATVHSMWAVHKIIRDMPDYAKYKTEGYFDCMVHDLRQAADLSAANVDYYARMIPLPRECRLNASESLLPYCKRELFAEGSVGRFVGSIPRTAAEVINYVVAVSENADTFQSARNVSSDGIYDELNEGIRGLGAMLNQVLHIAGKDTFSFNVSYADGSKHLTVALSELVGLDHLSGSVSTLGVFAVELIRYVSRIVHRGKFSSWSFDITDLESLARAEYNLTEQLSRFISAPLCALQNANGGNSDKLKEALDINLGGPPGTGFKPLLLVQPCPHKSVDKLLRAVGQVLNSVLLLAFHPDTFSEEVFDHAACELESAAVDLKEALNGLDNITVDISSVWKTEPAVVLNLGTAVASAAKGAIKLITMTNRLLTTVVATLTRNETARLTPMLPHAAFAMPGCWDGNPDTPTVANNPTERGPIRVLVDGAYRCERCTSQLARAYADSVGEHGDVCFALVGKRTRCCSQTGQCARTCGQRSTLYEDANDMVGATVTMIDDVAEPLTLLNPKARKSVTRIGYAYAQMFRMVFGALCNAVGPVSGQQQHTNADVFANGACAVDELGAAAGNIVALPASLIGQIIWAVGKNDPDAVKVAEGFEKLSAAVYGSIFSVGAEAGEITGLALRSVGMLLDANFNALDWKESLTKTFASLSCWNDEVRAGIREVTSSLDVSQKGYMCEAGDSVEALMGTITATMDFVFGGAEKATGSGPGQHFSLAVLYKALRRVALAAGNQVSGIVVGVTSMFNHEASTSYTLRAISDGVGAIVGSLLNIVVSLVEAFFDLVGLIIPPIRDIGIGGFTSDTYEPLRVVTDAVVRFLVAVAQALQPIIPLIATIVRAVASLLRVVFLEKYSIARILLTALFNFLISIPNAFVAVFTNSEIPKALQNVVITFAELCRMLWILLVELVLSFVNDIVFKGVIVGGRTVTGCILNFPKCIGCMGSGHWCDTKDDKTIRNARHYEHGNESSYPGRTDSNDNIIARKGRGGEEEEEGHETAKWNLSDVLTEALVYIPTTDPCHRTLSALRSLVVNTVSDDINFDWANLDDERDPTFSENFITRIRMRYEIVICMTVIQKYKRANVTTAAATAATANTMTPRDDNEEEGGRDNESPDEEEITVDIPGAFIGNATNLTAWLQTSMLGKDCKAMSGHPLCMYAAAVQEVNVMGATATAGIISLLYGVNTGISTLQADLEEMGVDKSVADIFAAQMKHDSKELNSKLSSFFDAVTDLAGVDLDMEAIVDMYARIVSVLKEAQEEARFMESVTPKTDIRERRSGGGGGGDVTVTATTITTATASDTNEQRKRLPIMEMVTRSIRRRMALPPPPRLPGDDLPMWWYTTAGGGADIIYQSLANLHNNNSTSSSSGGSGNNNTTLKATRFPGDVYPNVKWCNHNIAWIAGLDYRDPTVDNQAGKYLPPDIPEAKIRGCSMWCTEDCGQPAYRLSIEGFCHSVSECPHLSAHKKFVARAFCSRLCGSAATSSMFTTICVPIADPTTKKDLWYVHERVNWTEPFKTDYPEVEAVRVIHILDAARDYTSDYMHLTPHAGDVACQTIGDTGLSVLTLAPYNVFCQKKCDMGDPGSYIRLAIENTTESVAFKRLVLDICNDFCFPHDASCRRMASSLNCMDSAYTQAACMNTCGITWDRRSPAPRRTACTVLPTSSCDAHSDGTMPVGTDKSCRCPLDNSGSLPDYKTCTCDYKYGSDDLVQYPYSALPFMCPSTLKTLYTFFTESGINNEYRSPINYERLTDAVALVHDVTVSDVLGSISASTVAVNITATSDLETVMLAIAKSLFSPAESLLYSAAFPNLGAIDVLEDGTSYSVRYDYKSLNYSDLIMRDDYYLRWLDIYPNSTEIKAKVFDIDPNPDGWSCTLGVWTWDASTTFSNIKANTTEVTIDTSPLMIEVPSCIVSTVWKMPLAKTALCVAGGTSQESMLPGRLPRKCRTTGGYCNASATYDNPQPLATCIPEMHCTPEAMYLTVCNASLSDGYMYATPPDMQLWKTVLGASVTIRVDEHVTKPAKWVAYSPPPDPTSCFTIAFYGIETPATLMVEHETLVHDTKTYEVCPAAPPVPETFRQFQIDYSPNTTGIVYTFGDARQTGLQYSDGLDFCGELCGINDPSCLMLLHETPLGLNCTKYRSDHPSVLAFGTYGAKRWLCDQFPTMDYVNSDVFPLYGPGLESDVFSNAGFTYLPGLANATSCPSFDGSWGNNYDIANMSGVSSHVDRHDACAMLAPAAVSGQSPTPAQCTDVDAMVTRIGQRYGYATMFYDEYVAEFYDTHPNLIVVESDVHPPEDADDDDEQTPGMLLTGSRANRKALDSIASILSGLRVSTDKHGTRLEQQHQSRIAADQAFTDQTPCIGLNCQIYKDVPAECTRFPEPQTRPSDRLPPRSCTLSFIRPCTRVAELLETPDDPNDIFVDDDNDEDDDVSHIVDPVDASSGNDDEDGYIVTPVDTFRASAMGLIRSIRELRSSIAAGKPLTTPAVSRAVVNKAWGQAKLRLELAACAAVPGSSPCKRLDEAATRNPTVRKARMQRMEDEKEEEEETVLAIPHSSSSSSGGGGSRNPTNIRQVTYEHNILQESLNMVHSRDNSNNNKEETKTKNSAPKTLREAFDKRWVSILPEADDLLASCYILCGYNHSDLLERACLRDLFPSPDNLIWVVRDLILESGHVACDAVYETDGRENFVDGLGFNPNWFNVSKLHIRDPVRRTNGTTGEVQSFGPSAGVLQYFFNIGNTVVTLLVRLLGIGNYVSPTIIGGDNGDGNVLGSPKYLNGNYAAHRITAYALGVAGTSSAEVMRSDVVKWILNLNTEQLYGPTGLFHWATVFTPIAISCSKLRGDVKLLGLPIYSPMMLPMLPTWIPGKVSSVARFFADMERVVPPKMVREERGCVGPEALRVFTIHAQSDCPCSAQYYSGGEAYGFWDPLDSLYFVLHAALPRVANWAPFRVLLGAKYATFMNVSQAVDLKDYWWCFGITFWGNLWGVFVVMSIFASLAFGVSFTIAIVKLTFMLMAWMFIYVISGYKPTTQYRYRRPSRVDLGAPRDPLIQSDRQMHNFDDPHWQPHQYPRKGRSWVVRVVGFFLPWYKTDALHID